MDLKRRVFGVKNEADFNDIALEIFYLQYHENETYRIYCDALAKGPRTVNDYLGIPFLPVSFFKSHNIITGKSNPQKIFLSSGTTKTPRSRHFITDPEVYDESLILSFRHFYKPLTDYIIYALTPSATEAPDSSLVYMISRWININGIEESGFYLQDMKRMADLLLKHKDDRHRVLIIGLSYALIDFAEAYPMDLQGAIIMETGGMKGRRKDMVKEELHEFLSQRFRCSSVSIHSEYGMTELLSQAYSSGMGRFLSPPWMKILIRDVNDPLTLLSDDSTGGINVIDLANFNSCSFLSLQDLGKKHPDGSFDVLGRFDSSDLRGCNLMID